MPDAMSKSAVYAVIAYCIGAVGIGICALSAFYKIDWLFTVGFIIAFTGTAIFMILTCFRIGVYFLRKRHRQGEKIQPK